MSDYEPAGLEAREAADGLAYEEWRNRMRADDDEREYLRDEQKRENDPDNSDDDERSDDDESTLE